MKKRFTELSTNQDYIFFVAEIDKQIVGSIMGIVCNELYGEECRPFLLMEDLIVDEGFRKIGIGKALVHE